MILYETLFSEIYNHSFTKKIKVICEDCKQERICFYWSAVRSFNKFGTNLCKSCNSIKLYKNINFQTFTHKGRFHSNETKNIISKKNTGNIHTQESKEKISKTHKGVKKTQKHIENLSRCKSGKNHPFFGKTFSEEHRKNISIANLGKTFSEEHRKIISLNMTGEKNHQWKPSYKRSRTFHGQIRDCKQSADWKRAILARDNYGCVNCGNINNLEVDHIKPFALILKENNISTNVINENSIEEDYEILWKKIFDCNELWDINNGRVLCQSCHKKTDTWGYKTQKMIKTP